MDESSLADRVPVPILIVSRDGTVVRANDAAVDSLGAGASEGEAIRDVVVDADHDVLEALLEVEESTERSIRFDAPGRMRSLEVTATPVEDGVELVVDERAELERYRELVENGNDPMYVLDTDGCVESVNDALVEAYGFDREELVGSHATEFMPEGAFERGTEKLREILSGERESATLEFPANHANGETSWAEVNVGVLTDDGEYVGAIGSVRDVSERKRRERELADFEMIAEMAPVGLFTVDEEGVLTWANWRLYERLQMSQSELVGRPFTELVEAGYVEHEMIERYVDFVRELLDTDSDLERVDHEEVLYLPNGEKRHMEGHTALLPPDEDGEFTGTVNAFRDITRRKASQRELERQNERLEAFASVVSHDLRNPLNVAHGHLELARERHPDDEDLDEVAYSLSRMSELLEDLLALARQGETVGETEHVDLAATARRAWTTVETDDAELRVETDATIVGDRSRIQQLFENIFRNSVEHGRSSDRRETTEDGDPSEGADAAVDEPLEVIVEATEDGFAVTDDGPGLPAEVDLFEPGATTNEDGTGLGLAIVSEIVDAHGWAIDATESADGGARFAVSGVESATEEAEA